MAQAKPFPSVSIHFSIGTVIRRGFYEIALGKKSEAELKTALHTPPLLAPVRLLFLLLRLRRRHVALLGAVPQIP